MSTVAGRVTTPPLTLDPDLDAQDRHVLRGTARNGEPLIVRISCDCTDCCPICLAVAEAGEDRG